MSTSQLFIKANSRPNNNRETDMYIHATLVAQEPEYSGQVQKDTFPLFVIILLLLSIAMTPILHHAAATPYSSGYSHGCNDAEMSNPSDRYINQLGEGPSSHTSSFMQGYYNGYSDCSATSIPNTNVTTAAAGGTSHSTAYLHGYNMGLRNTTISTACTLYIGTPDWGSCDSGFDDGGAALQKTTPAYSYGTQVAKNNSVIGLYDTEDACAKYTQDYMKTSCKNGYMTAQDIRGPIKISQGPKSNGL